MQIEAGKYYRTRDGRKVGPAVQESIGEYPWNVRWDEGKYYYSNYGKSSISIDSDDIVAEWTEEHKTPHFTHILAEMQNLAETYGYTISEVSTTDGPLLVAFTLTN